MIRVKRKNCTTGWKWEYTVMFDFDGDGFMDPGEEYLAFRIWEEMCLEEDEKEQDAPDGEGGV